MENAILIVILVAIAGAIVWYLVRAKRNGAKCVSCPYAGQCGNGCSGGCHSGTMPPEKNE